MKKKTRKSLVATLAILTLGGTVTSIAVGSSLNKNRSTIFNTTKPLSFDDNISEYTSQVKKMPLTIFNPRTEIGLYDAIPTKANNPIYNSIFSKINKELITNDIFNFLTWIKESYSNSVFKYKILDFNVETKLENDKPKYLIEITFDIYNPEQMSNTFTFNQNNVVNNIIFGINEIKSSKLVIDSKAIPFFYHQLNYGNINNLYAGYYFENAHWIIGNKNIPFNKFILNKFSPTLNTVIENVDLGKNYFEIEEECQPRIKELTTNDFLLDIKNDFNNYWDYSIKAIGASQRIIREILLQKPLLETLNNIASDANILTESVINLKTPELKGLGSIIQAILENKNITELLSNNDVRNAIITISRYYMPEDSETVESTLNSINFADPNQFSSVLNTITIQLIESGKLDKQIADKINKIKDEGLLDILFNEKTLFNEIYKLLNPNGNISLLNDIQLLFNELSNHNPNKDSLLNIILDLVKLKDKNNKTIIMNLINILMPNNNLDSILNLFIFENDSLNLTNLTSFLDSIANPVDESNNLVDLEQYAKSINVVHSNRDFNFDNVSLMLSGNYEVKYEFTKKLQFNIGKLYNILPSWIKALTTTAGLPNKLELFPNDYFIVQYDLNDNVDYSPIKTLDNKHKLSWTTLANKIIDVNLPQTAKAMYNNTSVLSRSTLIKMYNSLFFKVYTDKKMFTPIVSEKLNNYLISDYSPNKMNGNAIFKKQLTQQELDSISNNIKSNIKEKEDKTIKYEYANSWLWGSSYIYKLSTTLNIDQEQLFNQLFDTTNCNTEYYKYINCNLIVPPMSIVGISTPQVPLFDINISLPFNVCSNDNSMTNNFTFKF